MTNVVAKFSPVATANDEPVGDLIAHTLAELGVSVIFGVISIHNMPILDAVARQGRIKFVPARSEAGAVNMADAYARVARTLGVVMTSTGTAAGNAAGSQVEAQTAGTPLLHITSQVDRPFMDRDRAPIHDVPRQAEMLKAISKSYFRVWEGRTAVGMLVAAARAALTSPKGPVSIEIPIDVQRERLSRPKNIGIGRLDVAQADPREMDELAERVKAARRPLIWLGGGAREAAGPARALVERGLAAVTSTNGRAVIAEDHPYSLGAFNMTSQAQAIYDRADLMIVVGSKLRGNETRNNEMRLPRPLVQIDADSTQVARNYAVDMFITADAGSAIEGLLARLPERLDVDQAFLKDIAPARTKSEEALRDGLGPYKELAELFKTRVVGGKHPFVRDVTVSNSTFGNRFVHLAAPHLGVHALGGGIGQGVAMAIGAAQAGAGKVVALLGDGGTMVNLGEFATAVETKADIVYVLMNDRGYGVIRNIQDAQYGGRHVYADLHTPDFGLLSAGLGITHERVTSMATFAAAFDKAFNERGPRIVEVDMVAIGPFAESFGGPPAGAAGKV